MSTEPSLVVALTQRVHPGLTLDVDLTLGCEFGIVFGPSGAGKTTLLRLIAGLSTPDRGVVRLDGELVFDSAKRFNRPLRARRVGMIFQDDRLFPHLSVASNVRFGLKGQPRKSIESRLDEIADLCGIRSLLDRWPATLSGGEKQRVGLARALAPRPRLLLCDEPISALDLPSRHALIERLRAVQLAEHIPVLYVTHSPAEAVALGTRLFYLEHGKITATGTPLDVLAAAAANHGGRLDGLQNTFQGRAEPAASDTETTLRLDDGPLIVVPRSLAPVGTKVWVQVRSDDILLARGPITGISARNVIPGVVERIVVHGSEAEVLVRTDGVTWIASVVSSVVASLELSAGSQVHVIVKARSCRVLDLSENAE